MWRIKIFIGLLLSLCMLGCNSEPERFGVSGSVSLDKKPLGNCLLVFQSLNRAEPASCSSAQVSDGKFAITQPNGLVAGDYGVILTENQPDLEEYEAAKLAGVKSPLNRKFLPPKYTVANELRVKVGANQPPVLLELKSR